MILDFSSFEVGRSFARTRDDLIREQMVERINEEVKKTFNPEFINRLDEVVIFNPLGKKEILEIVDISLGDIVKRVEEHGMTLSLTPGAKSLLAEKGYDPTYGARQLKRTVQKMIEDPLAEEILQGGFVDGSKIRVSKKGDTLQFVDENPSKDKAVDEEGVMDKDKA